MTGAISLEDLTVCYDRHPAVHHVSGQFEPGSMTGIVGPNGAGKSTLLQAILGLQRPHSGRVRLGNGIHDIAYLPQHADIDRSFPIGVLDVVLMGHWRRIGPFGGISPALRGQALECLDAVGLEGFGGRRIGSLSVGQLQRVLFARTMLQDCPVILLDEPFAALDTRTTSDLLGILRRWNGEHRTVIAVLHDLDQVRAHFPKTLLMARECLAWGDTATVLTEGRLRAAKCMAESWDDRAEACPLED